MATPHREDEAPGTVHGGAHGGVPGNDTPLESVTKQLIDAANGGDSDAWLRLFKRCEDRLRVLLRYRLQGSEADRDEVLQETWTQAIVGFAAFEYRGEGSFLRWLSGIMRLKILEARRSERRGAGKIDCRGASHGNNPKPLLDALIDTQTPSRAAWQHERVQRVQEVIDTLPHIEREALLCRYYEGLTLREAGERAGVDASTMLHRERRALAHCARVLETVE